MESAKKKKKKEEVETPAIEAEPMKKKKKEEVEISTIETEKKNKRKKCEVEYPSVEENEPTHNNKVKSGKNKLRAQKENPLLEQNQSVTDAVKSDEDEEKPAFTSNF